MALICIILLLGALTHAGALNAPFKTVDDEASIVNNPDIRSLTNAGKIFTQSFFKGRHYYRPLVTLSFAADYHFFGLDPFFYNLTNLALHLCVGVTVFFLMFLLLEDRVPAFFTSLLFVLHPVHWEAVANIPGRAILLSAFFTVNAFFFYTLGEYKMTEGAENRPESHPQGRFSSCLSEQRRRFAVCYGISLLLFAGGLLCKESAAMLPVVLLSYMFFSERKAKKYALVVPYFVLVAAYILWRRSLGVMEIYPWRSVPEHVLGFLTFLRAGLTYVRVLLWPVGLHFDRAQAMFLKFSDPELLATLIAYAGAAALLFKFRRRIPGYAWFFMTWFAIELFPVSQVVTTIGVGPGYISAAEHFLYTASIGAFALIVLGVRALLDLNRRYKGLSSGVVKIAVAGAFACLAAVTVYQEVFARSALAMLERTIEYNPDNARILYSTGMELVNRGRYAEAVRYFRRAYEREPVNAAYTIALGRSLYDAGKPVQAVTVLSRVIDAGPYTKLLKDNLDAAAAEAVKRYRALILREPDNAEAYFSLGTMYSRLGRIAESAEQYKRAAALAPGYRRAVFNLASSYGLLGEEDKAVAYFRQVVGMPAEENDGLNVYAYRHLGEIFARRGDVAQAEEYFKKAEMSGGLNQK